MQGRDVKIEFPENLGELHNLIKTDGVGIFYSGRMYVDIPATHNYYQFPAEIICLDNVEELKKISRSETYIDCGSVVPLSNLFQKASHLLPPLFISTIREFYNPAKLSCTTPAGIIYSGAMPTPLSLLFNVLEVSYEIKRLKNHRWRGITTVNHWIYHNQIYKKGSFELQDGDVVMRMRIPSNNWGHVRLRTINLGDKSLYLAITVDVARNYISNFRYSYALEGGELHRDREGEAHITGRTLNNSDKEIGALARLTADRFGLGKEEKIVRAIYKCIRNFLYQKSENGA